MIDSYAGEVLDGADEQVSTGRLLLLDRAPD